MTRWGDNLGALYSINFPNGRRYIGMTTAAPEKRFKEHRWLLRSGRAPDLPLYRAMKSFGVENVAFQVLAVANSREYLATIEKNAIRLFDTRSPNGYNLTDGGDGAPMGNLYNLGKKRSAETRAAMSRAKRGLKMNLTAEQRAERRERLLGNKHSLGIKHSDTTREKMSIAARGVMKKCSTTGAVGVSIHKPSGRFRAHLTINGKMIDLGRYDTIEEAKEARAAGEREHFK